MRDSLACEELLDPATSIVTVNLPEASGSLVVTTRTFEFPAKNAGRNSSRGLVVPGPVLPSISSSLKVAKFEKEV